MTMIHDVTIGERAVGDTHPCYITFEAGPTHDGLESAIRLANHAAHAGADAVKFQIVDPDRLVADKSQILADGWKRLLSRCMTYYAVGISSTTRKHQPEYLADNQADVTVSGSIFRSYTRVGDGCGCAGERCQST
jgi:sialic acid synthase SpsE